MKLKKILITAAAMACISIVLCTSAFAADVDDARFKDKSWDDVMTEFMTAHNIDASQITAAYYNTVTGEEHFINKDTLMYGASMAKLPTNMLYAERVSKGEMEMSTLVRGHPYYDLQRLSLKNSDNPAMEVMVKDLGGGSYAEFRKQILPYIGVSEEDATPEFLARNFFTPEQILNCLKLLYGNQEKYPGVESYMTQASPYDYFKQNQPPYTIAHKYGWYTDNGITYLNDCAIVYTTDPILLVMFTANVENNRAVLADYCSLMCDYAQYHRTLRYLNESADHIDLSVPTQLDFLSVNSYDTITTEYPQWQFITIGVGCALLIISLFVIFRKFFFGLFLILIACATIVAGGAPTELAYYALQENSAEQVIRQFSDAFSSQSRGSEYLTRCDSAMAQIEGTDKEAILTQAILDSFSLEFNSAKRVGNYLEVSATATKVDLSAVSEALTASQHEDLKAAIKDIDLSVLFDEEGNFLPDTLNAVLQNTFDAVLTNWNEYLYTEDVTLYLELSVEDTVLKRTPVWKIVTDEALISIINYT